MKNVTKGLLAVFTALALAACGQGGGSAGSAGNTGTDNSTGVAKSSSHNSEVSSVSTSSTTSEHSSTDSITGSGGSTGTSTTGSTTAGTGTTGTTTIPAPTVATPFNPATSQYMVLAWNELGMHCLNPSYDTAVILPPYNNLVAQVVNRGNPPQVVTSGVTVSYRVINNTTSANKGLYGQFWQYAMSLFGVAPALNHGLNLVDPGVSNGLSGNMLAKSNYFTASGIPVVPVDDNGVRNPYQVAEITVKNASGVIVAQTRATIPTSDEINCGKCHGNSTNPTVVFNDILVKHDKAHGTNLQSQKPVLCASCHGSPILGKTGSGKVGMYLSQAIHGRHSRLATQPGCYDCHPGATTKCNRSAKHTSADGNCTTCHGSLSNVAATVASGSRIPWTTEPKCVTCHNGVAGVDTGTKLYRESQGHGGMYCSACHGSPHAMVPSLQASDNYQAIQYQNAAKSLGDCGSCHKTSRGGGTAAEFASEHSSKRSACTMCHTGFKNAASTTNWPHQFQWKSR